MRTDAWRWRPEAQVGSVRRFLASESMSGFTLGVGLVVALAWSAVNPRAYQRVVNARWPDAAGWGLATPHDVVVNALLTVFFFAVGLELSRELRVGQLRTPRQAVLPFVAAAGGMVGTVLVALVGSVLLHSPALRHAWGVPMATDIAFTLGALSLVRGTPASLRLFLLALAVADDLLSVLVLSVSGHEPVHLAWLLVAVACGALCHLPLVRRRGSFWWWFAVVLVWIGLCRGGVEPSLAGVVVGLAARFDDGDLGHRLERQATPLSTWLALPLFAFVACGVSWTAVPHDANAWRLGAGLGVARLLGKVFGIAGAVALLAKLGLRLPRPLNVKIVLSSGLLCAIGFTVPLVFATSVFGFPSAPYAVITVALLATSVAGALLGIPLTTALVARATVGWNDEERHEDSTH